MQWCLPCKFFAFFGIKEKNASDRGTVAQYSRIMTIYYGTIEYYIYILY